MNRLCLDRLLSYQLVPQTRLCKVIVASGRHFSSLNNHQSIMRDNGGRQIYALKIGGTKENGKANKKLIYRLTQSAQTQHIDDGMGEEEIIHELD